MYLTADDNPDNLTNPEAQRQYSKRRVQFNQDTAASPSGLFA